MSKNLPIIVFGVVLAFVMILGLILGTVALGLTGLGGGSSTECSASDTGETVSDAGGNLNGPDNLGPGGDKPPDKYIPIYQAAAKRSKLGPQGASILAGIHYEETKFGDTDSNQVGATIGGDNYKGPMAWSENYFPSFAVDGNGDGKKDRFNVADAIFSSAKLLKSKGAPENWRGALYGYNHSTVYVDAVLADADKFNIPAAGGTESGSVGGSSNCPPADTGVPPTCDKLSGTPKEVIDQTVLPIAHQIAFKDITPETVATANGLHPTLTTSGNVSDHNGPPERAWAADISNGTTTPEEDKLAKKLAGCFGIKWSGSGLTENTKDGYRIQLIYRCDGDACGGNHFDHVHIGLRKE